MTEILPVLTPPQHQSLHQRLELVDRITALLEAYTGPATSAALACYLAAALTR